MRRIIRPGEKKEIIIETVSGDQDVDTLLTKAYLVLQREIQNLVMASARGKLQAAESKDLVAYIKLLNDIKLDGEALLNSMPVEQLNEALSKSNE
jgi:hypothetical protein